MPGPSIPTYQEQAWKFPGSGNGLQLAENPALPSCATRAERLRSTRRGRRLRMKSILMMISLNQEPECVCANLRRANRAVTHLFDLVLAPTQLRVTQFILLRAIASA